MIKVAWQRPIRFTDWSLRSGRVSAIHIIGVGGRTRCGKRMPPYASTGIAESDMAALTLAEAQAESCRSCLRTFSEEAWRRIQYQRYLRMEGLADHD